ncbi:hypothetical protein RhiJN_13019 [Ceratobasidium sp. AG-Ba]|nr:hypothetical protein RhiJN_13019 [Ceratobasidium sp. AG-Ba]
MSSKSSSSSFLLKWTPGPQLYLDSIPWAEPNNSFEYFLLPNSLAFTKSAPRMSLRSHPDDLRITNAGARSPEIHHPRPVRPPQLQLQRRVTISTGDDVNEIQESPTWRHYVPATADATTEKAAQSATEDEPKVGNSIQRAPSAPPALNYPTPTPTTIHPILAVRSILRARARMRLAWDVRFSPDVPAPSLRNNHRYSTGTISAIPTGTHGRPRSNTQPGTDLELASDLTARLNHNYNSIPSPTSTHTPIGDTATAPFTSHPLAHEPHDPEPRAYARHPQVGCTVLDVVRGIYNALQVDRRIDGLGEKTLFVCIGRDEALARRRLPARESLWSEVFVLTLAKREQR